MGQQEPAEPHAYRIFAHGVAARRDSRSRPQPTGIASATIIKESIEDAGRQVVHDLERYLNSLGTIAAITPLLGSARYGDRHGQGIRGDHDAGRR